MGMGGDGNETLWGRVGMELKTMGTGGDGCNFCPRAHLYYRPRPRTHQCSWFPYRLLVPSLDRHFSNALQVLHLTNGTFKPSTLTKENDFQTLLFPSSFIAKVNRSLCFQ